MKIYYAHSLHLYNTPQEKRDVVLLEGLGFEVVNPNSTEFQQAYDKWQVGVPDADRMMFFEHIVDECGGLAFRSHVDLRIPSGVMYEVDYAIKQEKLVFELPTIVQHRRMDVTETREYLKYNGQR